MLLCWHQVKNHILLEIYLIGLYVRAHYLLIMTHIVHFFIKISCWCLTLGMRSLATALKAVFNHGTMQNHAEKIRTTPVAGMFTFLLISVLYTQERMELFIKQGLQNKDETASSVPWQTSKGSNITMQPEFGGIQPLFHLPASSPALGRRGLWLGGTPKCLSSYHPSSCKEKRQFE